MKSTTDIYLAAAFLALDAKLERVDKTDPRHMQFEFSEPTTFKSEILNDALHSLDGYEEAWANGTLQVIATKYADALRKLKSIVHSH